MAEKLVILRYQSIVTNLAIAEYTIAIDANDMEKATKQAHIILSQVYTYRLLLEDWDTTNDHLRKALLQLKKESMHAYGIHHNSVKEGKEGKELFTDEFRAQFGKTLDSLEVALKIFYEEIFKIVS